MAATPQPLASRIRERNRHHSWLLRAPVLLWMAWLLFRYLGDASASSIWGGINLAFHEIGHILFGFLPEFWAVAGGTLTELAIPLVVAALFLRQKEDFGAAVALFWFATALTGAAVYAGDARLQALPLVSPFAGEPLHDWRYMLGRLGLLERDTQVAAILRGLGLLVMAGSVALGAWILRLMATDPERKGSGAAAPAGLTPGESLEAEGLRFQAWLAAREGKGQPQTSPGGDDDAPPTHAPPPEPRNRTTDAALDQVKDQVDPRSLSPEERRLLDFLERDPKDR